MPTWKLTTPLPGFTGEVGGVQFIKGEAVTDNGAVVAYCRTAGYGVELLDADPAEVDETGGPAAVAQDEPGETGGPASTADVPPPARNASTDEWRAWFVATGRMAADEAATKSRDELVAQHAKEASQ